MQALVATDRHPATNFTTVINPSGTTFEVLEAQDDLALSVSPISCKLDYVNCICRLLSLEAAYLLPYMCLEAR